MWYRIELNKDRSVRSCVEVSGSIKEGRSIHYIEADSKESAIAILARAYEKRLARSREHVRVRTAASAAKSLCVQCGCKIKSQTRVGGARCKKCKKYQVAQHRLRKAGLGRSRPRHKTDADRAASELKVRERGIQHSAEVTAQVNAVGLGRGVYNGLIRDRRRYTETLEAFETMTPSRFRGWLVAKIAECQDKIDGKKTIAEHLQAAE